jgi:hypothetical protein
MDVHLLRMSCVVQVGTLVTGRSFGERTSTKCVRVCVCVCH